MVTVTLRVAVAGGPPLPSCTVSVSVWEPGATLDVFHVNDAVGPVFEVEKIGGEPPSSCSVQLIVPVPLVSDMPTVTMPLTVAPSTGVVIDAVSFAGPGTTSVRLALPVLFTESRTLTVAVCVPPDAPLLLQGIEIGPLDVVVVFPTGTPSMLRVSVLEPEAFSSQIVNHTVLPAAVGVPPAPGRARENSLGPR